MNYTHGEAVNVLPPADKDGETPAPASPLRRRVFHGSASLELRDRAKPLIVKTALVAEDGIYVLHTAPLPRDRPCHIDLSLFMGGKRLFLSAEGRIGDSVCAGEWFRIAVPFTQIEPNEAVVLARLLRGR